ncbi:helix-turn-helix domain-containing protein [Photobacterium alginatilyticum]|uniref:AraC family transcriptional regulator n=2 Tax=Photobacterium alginatilyticum TaxID=1775171 RepID=A0ABW9YGX5_9GAMM|nr:AraC family transcriptional regulator [Photobacterium alginatilyticum]
MKNMIIRSKSISELHEGMGLGKPAHPLITIVDTENLSYGEELIGMKFTSDMYCIALKDKGCGIDYGRNAYDSDNGTLIFTAPDQVFKVAKAQKLNEVKGWMLYFHPDLIQKSALARKIDQYTFFDYAVHEALYLTEQEQQTLNQIVNLIRHELNGDTDEHSQQVLVSYIELMLNYCARYYERQLTTRSVQNLDIISRIETLLKDYYQNNDLIESGQPTIQYLASRCYLSPNYLSSLLSKETGRSAKDHINDFLVEKAKHLLLSSNDSVSSIAYSLGFNYPHYFARVFKQKTGKTPQEYRQI